MHFFFFLLFLPIGPNVCITQHTKTVQGLKCLRKYIIIIIIIIMLVVEKSCQLCNYGFYIDTGFVLKSLEIHF